ncbi:MAG: hypothetical protein K1000chlam3_00007 [Chlamydiae bacterium]|nr:hypothetical protein [Chlamydiota bacterium]
MEGRFDLRMGLEVAKSSYAGTEGNKNIKSTDTECYQHPNKTTYDPWTNSQKYIRGVLF